VGFLSEKFCFVLYRFSALTSKLNALFLDKSDFHLSGNAKWLCLSASDICAPFEKDSGYFFYVFLQLKIESDKFSDFLNYRDFNIWKISL